MELAIAIVIVGLAAAWLLRRALRRPAPTPAGGSGCGGCAGCAHPPAAGCDGPPPGGSPLVTPDPEFRRKP